MVKENTKMLIYIENALGKREVYLKVSDVGYVMTMLLGTNLTVTGEKVNCMLIDEGFQDFTYEAEYFPYTPKSRDIPYKKIIYKEKGFGIIKWHYSIIAKLLNIDFEQSIKKNITRIKFKFKEYRGLFVNYEIDENVLKEELSMIFDL